MQPYPAEKGIVEDYVLVVISVSFVCGIWIIMNEFVMKVGNIALGMVAGEAADIINFLVLIWRILPVGIIIGVWIWAFMRAFKREPYAVYAGGY